jgi:puromycin-sensitive aminopeptidase
LFEALGVLGADETVRARARELHAAAVADADAVEPNLAAAAVSVVADCGGRDEWELFRERYRGAATPQEEMRYLYALARFHGDDLMADFLDMTLGEVRTQNAPYVLGVSMANRDQGAQAWEFVRRNWETLNERFPSNSIPRMVQGVRTLTDPEVANDVFGFFAEHKVPQAAKTIEQHLERLRVNLALRERESERFSDSLENT